ncbi:hypothetical protein PU630_15095 [Microbacterium horticulturae]|uniref:MmcQ/YjbR family DNA-binding protein n=1 Tax=Microbacterium horticulturae TaxID=3028316 RepID=A0ABY8C0G6_9MICO|nr:hypothetical protein [Microbacterium sp. KACC 23027]WEG08551.1 hypothetical protein PU630_15095 [Microbacterium sp. KACC 23027]
MATLDDVRAICAEFPDVTESVNGHGGGASWRTKAGQVVWERGPRKADLAKLAALGRTWPDGVVVAIRTDGLDGKAGLLETFPNAFFDIPHFEAWPAVLTELGGVDLQLLRETITDSWLLQTTATTRDAWLAEHGPPPAS